MTPGYVCAIVRSIVTGKPVKWVEDRSENLMSTGFARDYIMSGRICAKDGRITGAQVDVIADHGAFDSTAQPSKFPAGFFHVFAGSYDLEAAHCSGAPRWARCSFRLPGHLPDRAPRRRARARDDVDPTELRMKNSFQPEQFPYENKTGWTYDSGDYEPALDKALRMLDYQAFRRQQAEARKQGRYLGVGVISYIEICGLGPSQVAGAVGFGGGLYDSAVVRVYPTGVVRVYIGASPHGQGEETTFAQIVAEEFGISPDGVQVRHADTDRTPFGLGTYGSRRPRASSGGCSRAARRVRDKGPIAADARDHARGPRRRGRRRRSGAS